MRLFVAVEAGEAARAALEAVQQRLEARLGAAPHPPRVRWVRAGGAHVTLRFIGEVGAADAARLVAAMTPAFDVPPFDVEWTTLGVFGGVRSPRVIWLGAGAGAAHLSALAAQVADRIDPLAGPGEARPFAAHLTIGRVKDPGRRVPWAEALAAAGPVAATSRVDRVTLFESRLSPRGPSYTALVSAALT